MNARIRKAEPADIPTLAVFEREISLISFGDEAIIDMEHHAKRLRKALAEEPDGMFVLEADGGIIGWLWMDGRTNYLTGEQYANFRSFYLTDAVRGSDYADELLAHGMAWCRKTGARRVVGKVHAGNLSMRALYKKAGFEATHLTMEYTIENVEQDD